MVASVCAWHEHHERATTELERRFAQREAMVVAAPALVEAYAVLTRLPPPHRLSPADAFSLLEANFVDAARLVALDVRSYRNLLRQAARGSVAGGRTYDSVIVACAVKAGASALLTFNATDFQNLVTKGLEIVIPAEASR